MTRVTKRFTMPTEFSQILIGMDRMFDDAFACHSDNYPPYNIYGLNGEICIEMAVAGFSKENIEIHLSTDNTLLVKAEKRDEENKDKEYIHRGLSMRPFQKKFPLSKDLEVSKSTCEDGILKIFIKSIPNKKDIKVINIE